MAYLAQAPQPLNVSHYESYFSVVAEISEELGLGYMTLSPDNQAMLKRLLEDYRILQARQNLINVGEEKNKKGAVNIIPLKIKVDDRG
jgi:hypothetical protein